MKQNKSLVLPFILLIVSAALYRLIPNRPAGFAPQLGMAIFGASIIKDKMWAFLLTIGSMVLSDLLFHILYTAGATNMQGFYEGQWVTYLTFMFITLLSFTMKRINITNVVLYTTVGSLFFFLITNFVTWKTGYGFARPQTWSGLMQCYGDALAYYRTAGLIPGFIGNFILGDLLWSALLFGGHYLFTRTKATVAHA
jgi:hypothetical protein